MSRAKFEKLANEMSKEDLVEMLMALYDSKKEAKDYFEYFLNPDEEKAEKKCKTVFLKEYTKTGVRPPKGRISKCKKALQDFEALRPSLEHRIDVRLYMAELASKYGARNWRIWEKNYKTIEKIFADTLLLISDHHLVNQYRTRIDTIQQTALQAGFWNLDVDEILL
ncbi:MAG: hypothetical protein IKP81_11450 [Paludibacteraceae bacterium]|nr:hypothetical protein [Paludibacteraceae bacterium]